MEQPVKVKMDTRADITAIPESVFTLLTAHKNDGLRKARKTLMGPGRHVLDVKGVFSAIISKNLFTPLLGRHAIERLNLITRLDNIYT